MGTKAYGFPLVTLADHVCGECYAENGKWLGGWTSSSVDFLKTDLAEHAEGYDYVFETDTSKLPEVIKNSLEKRLAEGPQ